MTATTIAVVSGGMDSVTMAYAIRKVRPGERLVLLSFDYGQRHVKELASARLAADRLDADHMVVTLPTLSGSALTDPRREVPEGHYAEESMRATVVPNRNMVMLSHAIAVAVAEGAHQVATAVHAGDHAVYPDCRPEFIRAITDCARVANAGFIHPSFAVAAPYVHKTKAQICAEGVALGVRYEDTWSCYKGGAIHCGRCSTCVERQEAFSLAGFPDPTEYADADYWATVTAR